jgi:peptidyl-prolyl cis-trans isomerase SurA
LDFRVRQTRRSRHGRNPANPNRHGADGAARRPYQIRTCRRAQLLDPLETAVTLRAIEMRKCFAILLLAALSCPLLQIRAEVADGIKAVVHDSVVTLLDVEDVTAPVAEDLRRDFRNQPDVFNKKLDAAYDENLEGLVQNQLILHEFATAGYNLPESIIDEYVQQRVKERFGDRATLTKTLAAQGVTYEKWRQDIRDKFIIEQMRYANIAKEIIVSPHRIEVYYLDRTNDFKLAEQVKLRIILLPKPADDTGQVRKLADEVLAKIKEGASFAEMATLYSQSSDRKQGGERDWEELSKLKKELAEAAAKLNPGQVSDVIETPEACYLMQLVDKQSAHIKPLNDVRDEIEKILLSQQRERLQQQWIGRLRKKTFVRYF